MSQEIIEEYIIEEVFEEGYDQQFSTKQEEKKETFVQNLILPKNNVKNELIEQKKGTKRKAPTESTRNQKKSASDGNLGTVMKLYAYKACLGKYNSLLNNADIPLWYRDNSFLLQKYLRHSVNDEGLFYYATNVYSCWEDQRASEYLELKVLLVQKKHTNVVVKILDIEEIENICLHGNFQQLGLKPYTNFEMNSLGMKEDAPEEEFIDEDDTPIDVLTVNRHTCE